MNQETLKTVLGLLQNAEKQLKQVISQTAQAGDYNIAKAASEVAQSLTDIFESLESPLAVLNPKVLPPRSKKTLKKRSPKIKTKKDKSSKYPKFEIRNCSLLRVGWSKKSRQEYSHKVSKTTFDQIIKAIGEVGKTGTGPFMAECFIGHINHSESEPISSYQVYVVIGFLRSRNCITQVGREGYLIPENLSILANEEWEDVSN